jgi:hypothetical protein
MLAGNACVSAEEAGKEWGANVVPRGYDHPLWNVGREPCPGKGLHVMRWRLILERSPN